MMMVMKEEKKVRGGEKKKTKKKNKTVTHALRYEAEADKMTCIGMDLQTGSGEIAEA